MSKSSNVLLALLGGVAMGAVLGLLLAPEKGSETRRKVSDAAKDFSDKVKSKAKKMADDFKKESTDESADIYS